MGNLAPHGAVHSAPCGRFSEANHTLWERWEGGEPKGSPFFFSCGIVVRTAACYHSMKDKSARSTELENLICEFQSPEKE